MKYWSYFVAKIGATALFLWGVWALIHRFLPEPEPFMRTRVSRFPQDLAWTSAFLGWFLLGVGILALAIWDQRRRCRICLTRLRMPVEKGAWSMATLLNPPSLESICPFGHGTFEEPEVHVSTRQDPRWTEHEDIWKELESIDRKPRP